MYRGFAALRLGASGGTESVLIVIAVARDNHVLVIGQCRFGSAQLRVLLDKCSPSLSGESPNNTQLLVEELNGLSRAGGRSCWS